jgi:beta-1,2-mannobiose phosphorylase / 1,2-beta-oligomannan phosphorylase
VTTVPDDTGTTFPFVLHRIGLVMEPLAGSDLEAEGVLNPGSARGRDGRLWLFPRLVAAGNRSRIAVAEVETTDGVPTGVRRGDVVLEATTRWEYGADHGGVEDPRITWVPALGLYLMTYVAFGPLGPHPALATSSDLTAWERRGPLNFRYSPALDVDLNIYANKDCVFLDEPVAGPNGRLCLAMLHRPTWDLRDLSPAQGDWAPTGVDDVRGAIWISYVDLAAAQADPSALVDLIGHREVARSVYPFEAVKIGAGPPPLRVAEGWLLLHHGVSGELEPGWGLQKNVVYSVGGMLLDAADPSRVLARTTVPLMAPAGAGETSGAVDNVVFPTAIQEIDGVAYVFYGMADSRIGVARLDRVDGSTVGVW